MRDGYLPRRVGRIDRVGVVVFNEVFIDRSKITEERLINRFVRQLLSIPVLQQGEGQGELVVDSGIVRAARQQIADRNNKEGKQKQQRRSHQSDRPKFAAPKRSLQADLERRAVGG